MLEAVANGYAAYLKLDFSNGLHTVQEVVDNMLTRLEELASVLQMIKLKNYECCAAVSEDINKYRGEIIVLSKKITTVMEIIQKLQYNIELIEKQVEKAEIDFGVQNENKLRSFLKPFLKRNKDDISVTYEVAPPDKLNLESVLDNFEQKL